MAADLRRHLSDLPLKGVGNRSLAERWGKWRRRRPFAFPLALTIAALLAVGGALGLQADRHADRAAEALRDGRAHAAAGRYTEAVEALRSGEALAEGLPLHGALRRELRDARTIAARAAAADDLHEVIERVRVTAASDPLPDDQARAVEARCRELWDRREDFVTGLAGQPTAEREDRWRADLLDTAVLAADLTVRAAPEADRTATRRQALTILAEAERLLGPARVIELERSRHARALGETVEAEEAGRKAATLPARGAWDHLTAGRSLLAAGDGAGAAVEFDAALARDPRSLWANHYRGVAALKLGQPAEAVAAFSACVALAPKAAWCAYNRGLAFAAAGRPERALADFDRAIELDPSFAEARAAAKRSTGGP
jgi:tetratricopeptide (TPR) repeat protein